MMWFIKILGDSKKSKRGFTLIELMIVVIVVGILAAAAIPMYARAMNRAKGSEGKALLGTIRTHYLVETAENQPVAFTDLATWGIDTGKNRWWRVEGTDFGVAFASPVFEITGLHEDITSIQLAINCDTGVFTIEDYSYTPGP